MQKNSLLKNGSVIVRVLHLEKDRLLIIDCIKRTMPKWVPISELEGYVVCAEDVLCDCTMANVCDIESLDSESKRIAYQNYTMIACLLPIVSDYDMRSKLISLVAIERNVSKQTVRHYLCLYLTYKSISVLAPKKKVFKKVLSQDEKNMRWALNKYYYSSKKNSLETTYTYMLTEKYCDASGSLLDSYPTLNQFLYFYRKTKKMQNYYISRDGLKNYQKNHRPLLGDGVNEFAPYVGIGMFDATVCDIYLVDDSGNLIGRPTLTACIDAYSRLCVGYFLSWEGGMYSLRGLLLNILSDKVELCKQKGIILDKAEWNCGGKLPSVFVTDKGSEYKSTTLEQITDLGVTIINLPSYRPELKSVVEKFFDLIQSTYKPYLKGKGVIEPDFQERGAHDYRKDACLTMEVFERIVLKCIVYYNSQRLIENYPYTEDMLHENISPVASAIWNYGKQQEGCNLISATTEQVILTLFPRTLGKFTRQGLKVNGMRYKNMDYVEKYLVGGEVMVAYNPDNVSFVWLLENGVYVKFELIQNRYKEKSLEDVLKMDSQKKEIVKGAERNNRQAKVELARFMETVVENVNQSTDMNIKNIRKNRERVQADTHLDYMGVSYHE